MECEYCSGSGRSIDLGMPGQDETCWFCSGTGQNKHIIKNKGEMMTDEEMRTECDNCLQEFPLDWAESCPKCMATLCPHCICERCENRDDD